MATRRMTQAQTQADTKKVEVAEVVESTIDNPKMKGTESRETVAIAVCLVHGIEFDDIPDGKGGFKSIVFPGINSHLKGKKEGILTSGGDALCINIAKTDWEHIKRLHGEEAAFNGRNGCPPCIYEFGTVKAFKSNHDLISQMRTGLEPIDPKSVNVVETQE